MKKLRSISTVMVSVSILLHASISVAHEGETLEPHDLWSAWEFDPLVIALLVLSAVLYTIGVSRLWQRGPRGLRAWNIGCYAAGWLSLVIALVSPLHQMGDVLFSAHMAQHEILMVIAAPLLVLGRPLVPYLWALPTGVRAAIAKALHTRTWRRSWRWLSAPAVAWGLHAIALWVWHIPALFQRTISSDAVHAAQHFCFLGSALLFTWSLLQTYRGRRQYGAAVAYVFTTAVHTSLLAALLTFATRLWYPIYSTTTAAWGYTPLEDQQLGGLIMWVPAGVIYTIAGLAFFGLWITQSTGATVSMHDTKGAVYVEA